jgi:hypothetical protein
VRFLDISDLFTIASSTSTNAIFSVPFERDRQFVGREDVITQIEEKLQTQYRVSLYGIGGIG